MSSTARGYELSSYATAEKLRRRLGLDAKGMADYLGIDEKTYYRRARLGGLHGHARWHHRGQPVLYTAVSPSLALLEVLVHIDPRRFEEQTLLRLEIEDDAEHVTHAQLVQLLRDAPAGDPEARTRDYGTSWLAEKRTLALIVPSLVMPFENNVILNPLHPAAKRTRITARERVTLDERLVQRLSPDQP